MYELFHESSDKLRWLVSGIAALIVALLLSAFILPTTPKSTTQHTSAGTSLADSLNLYDSPNAVTTVLAASLDRLDGTIAFFDQTFSGGTQSINAHLSNGGKAIASGVTASGRFIGHGLASTTLWTVRAGVRGIGLIFYIPKTILGIAVDNPVVSAMTQPANSMTHIPTIDLASSITPTAYAAAPATKPIVQAAAPAVSDGAPVWPLHGAITTMFGANDLPFQLYHTGIDISDGARPGVTPVKAFKPGHVIDVIHSYYGLGNHIIVDNGNGITSVYGHLYSTSVVIGQAVDQTTTLGYEGSTGASTGTHLHFEIRVNGVPQDPLNFIAGRP